MQSFHDNSTCYNPTYNRICHKLTEEPVSADVPASWFGSSTAALQIAFEQRGYSRIDAISAACAQKYGIPQYFLMHRQERIKADWQTTFLEICRECAVDVDEKNKTVLVVGVNDGMDVEHFRHCRGIGIDPCRAALRLAQSSFPQHVSSNPTETFVVGRTVLEDCHDTNS